MVGEDFHNCNKNKNNHPRGSPDWTNLMCDIN